MRPEAPADCTVVTYERLHEQPAPIAALLFRFLGVSDEEAVVADCVARTSFAASSGGPRSGGDAEGSFLREGVVGDWPSTFSPGMNAMILRELGWMFPHFRLGAIERRRCAQRAVQQSRRIGMGHNGDV
jgi:hypothetical protein